MAPAWGRDTADQPSSRSFSTESREIAPSAWARAVDGPRERTRIALDDFTNVLLEMLISTSVGGSWPLPACGVNYFGPGEWDGPKLPAPC
jgi:hypothetical protein